MLLLIPFLAWCSWSKTAPSPLAGAIAEADADPVAREAARLSTLDRLYC